MGESRDQRAYENLARFCDEFFTDRDPYRRIEACLRAVTRLFDEPTAALLLVRDGKNNLRVVASHDVSGRGGIVDALIPIEHSLSGKVVQSQAPINVSMVELPRAYIDFTPVMRSELGIPLAWQEQVIGALLVESTAVRVFDGFEMPMVAPFRTALAATVSELFDTREADSQAFETIQKMRQRQVLVLGKDTPPEDVLLLGLAQRLRDVGYVPLLVKAFPDFRELSNEEKVRVFADVSRFVVIENSYPAGQIAECKICAVNRIVTAMMRRRGTGSSYMVTDYDTDFNFMREFEYEPTEDGFSTALGEAVAWAEQQIRAGAEFFDKRYPWRGGV